MNFREYLKLNEADNLTISVGLFDKEAVDKEYNDYYKKMYNVKLSKASRSTKGLPKIYSMYDDPDGSQTVSGSKENLIKFLTGEEPYGFDLSDVKKGHPELF